MYRHRTAAPRNPFVLAENCCDPSEMGVWQNLDDRLRAQAADDDVSGSVLLTRAGQTIFHGCYGLADRAAGVPIGPETRFGLASVTKMFTAVAVADQVSAGRLTLDSRVVDLLPPEARPSTLHPRRHRCPPAPAHVWDRRLCRGGRHVSVLPGGLRLPVAGAAQLPHAAPPGFPAALRGPAALSAAGSNLAVLQRGLHPARDRPRARHGHGPTSIWSRSASSTAPGMSASGFFRLDEPHADVAVGYLEPDISGTRSAGRTSTRPGDRRCRRRCVQHRDRPRSLPPPQSPTAR